MAATGSRTGGIGCILKVITVALFLNCFRANCQQQAQEPQKYHHLYQQMQYQMQQQQKQQYDYQQYMQQQRQQQQQQQYQQQYHQQCKHKQQHPPQQLPVLPSSSSPQEQQQSEAPGPHLTDFQAQALKTGASLVVDGPVHQESSEEQIGQPRQRTRSGLCKRKTRPQYEVSSTETPSEAPIKYFKEQVQDDAAPDFSPTSEKDDRPLAIKRRKQPAIREPLAALEKEQQLYEIRDKKHQFAAEATEQSRDKSYRRPYSQAKKDMQPTSTFETFVTPLADMPVANKSSVDLKHILKNSGGLSLSEILQQKNLSLDDLLKGKQTALLALQTTATSPQQSSSKNKASAGRRVAASAASTTATAAVSSAVTVSDGDSLANDQEPRVKQKLKSPLLERLKLFGSPSRPATPGNSDSTAKRRVQTTTSAGTSSTSTTTRLPLYKKRQQHRSTLKPPFLLKTQTSTLPPKDEPVSMENLTTLEQQFTDELANDSREVEREIVNNTDDQYEANTNHIELISTRRMTTSSTLPPTTVRSRTKARTKGTTTQFFAELKPTTTASATDRFADDLENLFETSSSERNEALADDYPLRVNDYKNDLTDTNGLDDRTDLLELIEDRRSGNRLLKVLQQRNMTLEELLEHRKRGSSQLHLSTVLQNQSRFFPGQKVVLNDNMDIVTAFENFPHFNLMDLKSVKPDDIKTDSQGSSYFTSIIDIQPTDEASKYGDNDRDLSYLQLQRADKSLSFYPSWKTLALASYATTVRNAGIKGNPFFLPQPELLLEGLDGEESVLSNDTDTADSQEKPTQEVNDVEAIENEVARAHDLLDLELSGHAFKRSPAAAASTAGRNNENIYAHMPAGIRSAIVASAAIVITSMVTFLIIFVACRWKQRNHRKKSYAKTYNAMKSKLPTIATASRTSLHNMDELVDSTASTSPPFLHHQRQNSLLFSALNNDNSCTNTLLGAKLGLGSAAGSTTTFALSLRSANNLSTTKLNTMDPTYPEVHEYLCDKLRRTSLN